MTNDKYLAQRRQLHRLPTPLQEVIGDVRPGTLLVHPVPAWAVYLSTLGRYQPRYMSAATVMIEEMDRWHALSATIGAGRHDAVLMTSPCAISGLRAHLMSLLFSCPATASPPGVVLAWRQLRTPSQAAPPAAGH